MGARNYDDCEAERGVTEPRLTRRRLLEAGAASAALAAIDGPRSRAAQDVPPGAAKAGARPKNIVFMVADGMSMGVPALAESFSHLVRGRGTTWIELLREPRCAQGWFDTASLTGLVTDSSAASSAWGSGARVFNSAVNVLPDGTKLVPLAELCQRSGRRVGLVTTTTITHATPAGFAAIEADRDHEAAIAPQYLGCVDVLMGGGRKFFAPALRSDGADLIDRYSRAGYALWSARDAVLGAERPVRILGLFAAGHLPMSIDQRNSDTLKASVPTLPEMTQAALDSLATASKGFLLQVEGGRVDHAAHNNDAAALLWDQLAFDDAIEVVLRFMQKQPETLLVITTDHGNSNPGLNGMGKEYRDSSPAFEKLVRATSSYEALARRLRPRATAPSGDEATVEAAEAGDGPVDADGAIEIIRDALQIELKKRHAERLAAALRGKFEALGKQHQNLVGTLGEILSNYTGIGWTGTTHTSDLALVTALGAGQERFNGWRLNRDAFDAITDLFDIRHANPQMTPAEARKYAAAAPREAERPHWI